MFQASHLVNVTTSHLDRDLACVRVERKKVRAKFMCLMDSRRHQKSSSLGMEMRKGQVIGLGRTDDILMWDDTGAQGT